MFKFHRLVDAVLPSQSEYLGLQQQQLLLTSTHTERPPTSLVSLTTEASTTTADRRARSELVCAVKESLDVPMNDTAVLRSWCPAYWMAAALVAVLLILILLAWLASGK